MRQSTRPPRRESLAVRLNDEVRSARRVGVELCEPAVIATSVGSDERGELRGQPRTLDEARGRLAAVRRARRKWGDACTIPIGVEDELAEAVDQLQRQLDERVAADRAALSERLADGGPPPAHVRPLLSWVPLPRPVRLAHGLDELPADRPLEALRLRATGVKWQSPRVIGYDPSKFPDGPPAWIAAALGEGVS